MVASVENPWCDLTCPWRKNSVQYEQNKRSITMWTPINTLRIIMFACLFGMVLIAVLYLRQRKLSTMVYLLWGLLALILPVVGPYLVIASRPGEPTQPAE